MLAHLLRTADIPTGFLSTIGYELPDGELRQPPAHFTTPEAPQVQLVLRRIVDEGGRAAVVESSSHALAMERVGSIEFDVAVWTQITPEHLDLHNTMEEYFAAKRKLIERAHFAVLNAEDSWTERLRAIAPEEWTYSVDGADADWRAFDVEATDSRLRFSVDCPIGKFDVTLPMVGRFNVGNAVAAMAAAARAGARHEQIAEGFASFAGVLGRMQAVTVDGLENVPQVIVDYAHTPPGLELALATARDLTRGKVWVVFGASGGNRDPRKRGPLGEVAARLADQIVLTEQDHRSEPLQKIIDEIARGVASGSATHVEIPDRTEAIRYAILNAGPDDVVMLTGKGPEDTLQRGDDTIAWDEVETAREALRARGQGDRPK